MGWQLRRRREARTGSAVVGARRRGDRTTRGRTARIATPTTGAPDIARVTGPREVELPYDGDVIGAVQRSAADSPGDDIVVCAAGTLPAELHKLWRTSAPGGYHVEYGYSCMGYEIAGGLGVKMARPDREVIVMVGDGSYLMLNSEIATSVMLGQKLIDRRARQPRLRLHQPAAAGVRAARRSTTCSRIASRDRTALPRSTSPRMRARWARTPRTCGPSPSSKRRCNGRGPPIARTSSASRPIRAHDRGRRLVVGSGGAGSLGRPEVLQARARYEQGRERQQP